MILPLLALLAADVAHPIPASDQVPVLQIMAWQYKALSSRETAYREMLSTPAGLKYLQAQKSLDEANQAMEMQRQRLSKTLHCDPCKIDDSGTVMVPAEVPTIIKEK